MSGRVVHFEIPYDDSERASRFYSSVFGWQVMPMPDMNYVLTMTGPTDENSGPSEPGFINGGMYERRDDFTSPNIVIDVDNIEASLKSVAESGGTIVMERQPVGNMGFTAYFKDSEGNLVGLWETAPQEE